MIAAPHLRSERLHVIPASKLWWRGNWRCCGAAYSIAVTVNGFTYSETESNPFINYAYLLDLSNGLAPNGLLYQQAFQEVESSGCSTVYGVCTSSYILATSQQTPFVFKLDFNHPLHSTELDPGSNTYFVFRDGPDLNTGFYGSIADVRVHPNGDDPAAPLPPSWALMLTALAF